MAFFFIYNNMKKFKTKHRMFQRKKLLFIILTIFLFIVFIIISFQKLKTSHNKLIDFLLKNTSLDNNPISMNYFNNFNYFFSNYSFDNEKLVFNEKKAISKEKVIYIYNTHDTEKYHDQKSVVDAAYLLQNNLKKLGIKAIVEDKKTSDYANTGLGLYEISRGFMSDITKKEDITYYIDLHRDSVTDTKITINKQNYAKILFVLGLDNPNYQENKEVLTKMNNYLNENYPGLSKGILEKSGKGVNGIYNQDLGKNVLLIEIGGIENNLEEVNNSTQIIALMLYNMLGD